MIVYNLLRLRCGLSQPEAAALHGVRLDTVKSWCAGRNAAPAGVLAELRGLHERISRAAIEALAIIAQAPPDAAIELGYAADDAEAQSLGWPCVGAQAAMLGEMLALLSPDRAVRLIPRGASLATAAAADAHGR